ncbi:hypothetical protein [Paenibacillus sp. NAIST15-1]|uniref:hypothetical protein n=1 Tax=Paenibacillus sp. NAIST15-1 TaxID=1605994 RepID=UPI0008699F78|nr:hypothetical protein [Paenibacillus sp. NAIST15-1]GAV11447.1 orotate phosphoribosyltransferase [Paenibacillus sp. NAIST15-1]
MKDKKTKSFLSALDLLSKKYGIYIDLHSCEEIVLVDEIGNVLGEDFHYDNALGYKCY